MGKCSTLLNSHCSGCSGQYNPSARLPERAFANGGSLCRATYRRHHTTSRLHVLCGSSVSHCPPHPSSHHSWHSLQTGLQARVFLCCLHSENWSVQVYACMSSFYFYAQGYRSSLLRTFFLFGLQCSLGDPNLHPCLQLSWFFAVLICHKVKQADLYLMKLHLAHGNAPVVQVLHLDVWKKRYWRTVVTKLSFHSMAAMQQ